MKVRVTVEVDERFRRALRLHRGEEGSASREEIRAFVRLCFESTADDVLDEAERKGLDSES